MWCVDEIKSRPVWLVHSEWPGEELGGVAGGRPWAMSRKLCRQQGRRFGFCSQCCVFLRTLSTAWRRGCRSQRWKQWDPNKAVLSSDGERDQSAGTQDAGERVGFRAYSLRKSTGFAAEWEVVWGRGWGKQGRCWGGSARGSRGVVSAPAAPAVKWQ